MRHWLWFWKRPALPDEERRALERWVRLKLRMTDSDPLGAIKAAIARLTSGGMDRKTAIQTIERILSEQERPAP
jgi:hypothetical protein